MNRDEWIENFRQILLKAGISQTKAWVITMEQYGRDGMNADLSTCPFCCATEFLLNIIRIK